MFLILEKFYLLNIFNLYFNNYLVLYYLFFYERNMADIVYNFRHLQAHEMNQFADPAQ